MKIRDIHGWEVDIQEARQIQRRLSNGLIFSPLRRKISLVAGADVSFSALDKRILVAAVVIVELPGLEVVEEAVRFKEVRFPYVPGYLSFREAPPLIDAFRKLKHTPDAAMFDGQGIAHPRGFGLASHMGLILDIPSFGCAKKKLTGEHEEPGISAGSRAPLLSGEKEIGAVLRTREGVKPVYISPGHRIDIDGAVDVTMRCLSGYRLPEPVRQAHHLTRTARNREIEPVLSPIARAEGGGGR